MRFNYKILIISTVLFSVCDNVFGDAEKDYKDKITSLTGKLDDLAAHVVSSNASKAITDAQGFALEALEETKTYAKDTKASIAGRSELTNIGSAAIKVIKAAIDQDYIFMEASGKRYENSKAAFDSSDADKHSTATATASDAANAAVSEMIKVIHINQASKQLVKMAEAGKSSADEKDNTQANEMFYNAYKTSLSHSTTVAKLLLRSDAITIAVSLGTTFLAAAAVVSVALF